jgi:hypothetical protein
MGDNVGTPRKVVIDGVSYDCMMDMNITFNYSKYEIEAQPTTGKTLFKRTKRNENMESIALAVNPTELEEIRSKSNSLADKTFSVELADGSIYKSTGQINFENYETETGKATMQFLPNGEWTPFLSE